MTRKEKQLITTFGDRYVTIENNGGYCLYDKEQKARRSNFKFLGKFYIATSKDKYVYNEETYSDIQSLIAAMEKYNATLPFDAELYDPTYRKHYLIECCLHDYLKSLGIIMDTGIRNYGTYNLSDCYGQNLCTLIYKVDEDTTKGVLTRIIPSENQNLMRYVEAPFNDLDSAIAAVNTMLATHCATINAQMINVLNTLTNSRSSLLLNKTFDVGKLTEYTEDAKAKMIEEMEKQLALLKGEQI